MKRPVLALSAWAVWCLALTLQLAGASERETATRSIGDDLFMAGGNVRLTEGAAGDAILAGGKVATSGSIRGDQVAAGGQLELNADTGGGLYAAGGTVRLDGKVARNARMAGGDVEVGPEADVQGGVTIGAGRVEINGHVGKYLNVGAGHTRIDGHIGGDVEVSSGDLDVGPGAIIDGTLTYYGPQAATVAAGAQIKGAVHYVQRKGWGHGVHTGTPRGFGVGAWLWLIGWIGAGCLLLALWPGFARVVTDMAQRRPGMALLMGFVVLVCAPIALLLLMVTVIGIPLALLGICLYLALLPLGYLASAASIGEWLLSRMRQGAQIVLQQRILMLIGVLIVLFVLTRVPWLGSIVKAVVVLAGVGSLVMAAAARHRAA